MRAFFIIYFLKFLSFFPLIFLHHLGNLIGRLLFIFPNKAKAITQANIQHCFPNKAKHAQQQLIKLSLIEMGKTFTESAAIWFWPKEKLATLLHESPSTNALKKAIQQNQGAIILAPHLGAWEVCGLYCSQLRPLTVMYRPPRLTELEPIIIQGRERLDIKLAATDAQGIRALSRALKNKECIAILPDQDPGKNGGVFAPFFNQPANTMTLVSRLAMKGKVPVFFIYAERMSKGKGYLIHCKQAPDALTSGTLEESVVAMNQVVEQCVQLLPTQYQWSYKRFKNQPKGMPNIYRRAKKR